MILGHLPGLSDQAFFLKNGFKVYQAMAGKKTIGTPSPGNNSGDCTFKGKVMDMGMITDAKVNIENNKLNTTSVRLPMNLESP